MRVRGKRSGSGRKFTDLPTGVTRKPSDLHAMRRATGAWDVVPFVAGERIVAAITAAWPAGKLDGQSLTHELGSIFLSHVVSATENGEHGGVNMSKE